MSEIGKNMMIISSPFRNAESFALVPVTSDTPYVEAMFDPASGILAVISKVSKQSFHMVPRLGDDGQPQRLKVPNKATGKTMKEQRVSMETFSEFYITDKEEIKNFINIFAINADSYDFAKYVDVDVKETKKEPLIIT